jgi:hypothetical protein
MVIASTESSTTATGAQSSMRRTAPCRRHFRTRTTKSCLPRIVRLTLPPDPDGRAALPERPALWRVASSDRRGCSRRWRQARQCGPRRDEPQMVT